MAEHVSAILIFSERLISSSPLRATFFSLHLFINHNCIYSEPSSYVMRLSR